MKKTIINCLTTRVLSLGIFALLCSTYVSAQVVIQRCDLTTGWQGAQSISVDKTDKKEGSGSLSTNAQTGNSDWFTKSFAPTRTGITSSGYLSFWLYVSDASKLDGGQIEISSSGSADNQESNWSFDKNSVTSGWNLMQLQISSASETGGGANLDNINFFRIYQNVSGPVSVKIDFIRFTPSTSAPVWPVLDVPEVDNSSLDGKVMFGYQGWFNHPDDDAGLGWVHWGDFYEPIKSHVDMYPDMREYGLNEKYPSHYTMPDGSIAPVYSSYNRNSVVRHMKWVRDYNLDGVFIQRFISAANDDNKMAHKDSVTRHVMGGCEKYGRVFAIMYDGIANQVEDMKKDWMHLVDDIGVTNSDRYLHHNGLPLVSMWGYTNREDATVDQLEEMIEFFTNNPNPKYRAAVKLGVRSNWYDHSTRWMNAFKNVDVISPWFSGHTDYDKGQNWCDENGVDYLPVVHPGFSWYNMTINYEPDRTSGQLNKDPRDNGNYLWGEVNDVVTTNVKSIYIAMFDEVDEGTAMFKLAENEDMLPREGKWVPLDIDGYNVPSDWYLRLASLAANVVRGYEDNQRSFNDLSTPPEGVMTIRITDEANDNDQGAMEFIFPDFPNESTLEISIDGGNTFTHSTPDNVGTYTVSDLTEANYSVFVRHNAASPMVDMGDVFIGNVIKQVPAQASNPFPANSASEIRINTSLGWTASEHVVSHNIYFGTTASPEFIKYQLSTAYNPGELEPNTTYYWRIDEVNASGTTEGQLWSFTTGDIGGPKDIVVLDYCDEVSVWRSSNGMSLDSDDKQEGFASLSCSGAETNKFTKKFETPVNTYCDETSYLVLWIYVSDVSAFDGGGQIEISSSGKNDVDEYNWSVGSLNLVNGWNEVHLAIEDAGKMGEPDLSAINFFRFYQKVSSEIVIKIDYIHFTDLATTSNSIYFQQGNSLNGVKLYPNPASSECTIQLPMEQSADVSVSIFDLSGRELHHFINKQQWKPGDHTLILPLNGFEKGTYIINIKVDSKLFTKKLVII